jgi:hypothetical protein
MLDSLRFMQSVGMAGHKIGPYLAVNPHRSDHIHAAQFMGGGLLQGYMLPQSAQGQFEADVPWSIRGSEQYGDLTPGSLGGHGVISGADLDGTEMIATWAKWQPGDEGFRVTYNDESYLILAEDWFDNAGLSPIKVAKDKLWSDFKAVKA